MSLNTFCRDRAPFVFTPDMAYVINGGGGDKGENYQHFCDLCCSAFQELRKNANLIVNLFELVSSGVNAPIMNVAYMLFQKCK